MESKKTYIGIMFFAGVIILSSIHHMRSLVILGMDPSRYERLLSEWPDYLITARYYFSWGQRVIGFVAGVGLLYHKDLARKVFIAIGIFTLCVLYWKHPYYFIENIAREVLTNSSELKQYGLTIPELARICVIVINGAELLFWGAGMFYFTRPKVKSQFK